MTTLPPVLTPLSRLPDFDPRRVPVLGTDADLPPVPDHRLQPEALWQRFQSPPVWTPEVTHERRFADRSPAHASVLVPIVLRDQPTVLLTLRTTQLSTHSGQVAFPGGRVDDTDPTPADTALREAHEEVGLAPDRVQVLGQLPLYTTGTAFMVTPVVGLVRPDFTLSLNPHEVAAAFEVPLSFLMNPANHRRHAFEAEGVRREWFSMPWMDGEQERFIWGATAGMLRNFYRFLSA